VTGGPELFDPIRSWFADARREVTV
jgi:hypothetical protein